MTTDLPIARAVPEPSADRGKTLVQSAVFSAVLALYTFVVVERKQQLVLGHGPFLRAQDLVWWEKVLYCLFLPLEIILLVATLSVLLHWLLRPVFGKRTWLAPASVAFIYFTAVTGQFRVLRYVRDGIDLTLVRALGGGSLWSALGYVKSEIADMAPTVVAAAAVIGLGGWMLNGRRPYALSPNCAVVFTAWSSRRRLLVANLAIMILVPLLSLASPGVHRGLGFSIAHEVYTLPAAYLTDPDRDGYGVMDNPPDFAPFDASRHPYALEIPGNGIDEDGVGGDLPQVIRRPLMGNWDPAQLERRNVVVVVLESARYDLLDHTVDGRPVMPVLANLPGARFSMFSHSGYTATSLSALMNGSVFDDEGIPLIDRFRALNYRTGVFSAQSEDFGETSRHCHLRQADTFLDAASFPKNLRMYSSTELGALAVPAAVVNHAFHQWAKQARGQQPFFAYLNWQEMHFPYYYQNAPRTLLSQPIPRARILPENRAWLLRTYQNAARSVDSAAAALLGILDDLGVRRNTVLIFVGDHGEELFEHGYLGHGTNTSYEQNGILAKLVNGRWNPPQVPLASSELPLLIYNNLLRSPAEAIAPAGEVICYAGHLETPSQLALMTTGGLVKYNFRTGFWSRQLHYGDEFAPALPADRVIHLWESLRIVHAQNRPR